LEYLNTHFTNKKINKMASAEKKFTILIDKHKSAKTPGVFGQKGHFQVSGITYTIAQTEYSYGGGTTVRKPELPTFSLIPEQSAGRFADNVRELEETLEKIGEQNEKSTVTLFTLINTSATERKSDLDTWEIHYSQELPEAQLLPIQGTDKSVWIVKADAAVLGRGDKAAHKIAVNYREGTGKWK
jgi:hypothetical protein